MSIKKPIGDDKADFENVNEYKVFGWKSISD